MIEAKNLKTISVNLIEQMCRVSSVKVQVVSQITSNLFNRML